MLSTLQELCKQKIVETIPYNEIIKLPINLQNEVLTINKVFSFEDELFLNLENMASVYRLMVNRGYTFDADITRIHYDYISVATNGR
jgi:hypothetical protein